MVSRGVNGDKETLLSGMELNDNKAGMQGLDKEKINKIILENTIGSSYFKNQKKRDDQVKKKVEKILSKRDSATDNQKKLALHQADQLVHIVETHRDLTRTIIHIDMDAFYASVEELEQPDLKEKPMAVGSIGMLATSNYAARKFGVRAAMPGFIAKKLCPSLVIISPNFNKYRSMSLQIQDIFKSYDINFVAPSLDEAYLDITEHLLSRVSFSQSKRTFVYNSLFLKSTNTGIDCNKLSDDVKEVPSKTFGFCAEDVAEEIRFRIEQKTLLTASAGIAPNTMLAKIGSDMNKPNGQTCIPPNREKIMDFISALPIRKINGIGKVSEQLLSALGVTKCEEMYERRADLFLVFTPQSASFFLRTALASSSNRLASDAERKSISTERTFNPIGEQKQQLSKLRELCHALACDMKKDNIRGRTVTLKMKTKEFELRTRSKTSDLPAADVDDIFNAARGLLIQEFQQSKNQLTLRLMGVAVSKLEESRHNKCSQKRISEFLSRSAPCSSSAPLHDVTASADFVTCQNPAADDDLDLSDDDVVAISTSPCDNPTACTGAAVEPDQAACSSSVASFAETPPEADGASTMHGRPPEVARGGELASAACGLQCPGCGKPQFSGIAQLNAHLDTGCASALPTTSTLNDDVEVSSSDQIRAKSPPSGISAALRHARSPADASHREQQSSNAAMTCPICRVCYSGADVTLTQFNQHVDACLNRATIRDLIKSGDYRGVKNAARKRRKTQSRRGARTANDGETIKRFFQST